MRRRTGGRRPPLRRARQGASASRPRRSSSSRQAVSCSLSDQAVGARCRRPPAPRVRPERCAGARSARREAPRARSKAPVNQNVLPSPASLVHADGPADGSDQLAADGQAETGAAVARVVEASACENGSKSRSWAAAAMPTPVSVTSNAAPPRRRPGRSTPRGTTTSPASVNFTALEPGWTGSGRAADRRSVAGQSGWQSTTAPGPWPGRSASSAADLLEAPARTEVGLLELELARLQLGEVQDVVDQRQQRPPGALDAFRVAAAGRRRVRCAAAGRSAR